MKNYSLKDVFVLLFLLAGSVLCFLYGSSAMGVVLFIVFCLLVFSPNLSESPKKECSPDVQRMLDSTEAWSQVQYTKRKVMPKNPEMIKETVHYLDLFKPSVDALAQFNNDLKQDKYFMARLEKYYFKIEEIDDPEPNEEKRSKMLTEYLNGIFLADVLFQYRKLGRQVSFSSPEDCGFAALILKMDDPTLQGETLLKNVLEILTKKDKKYLYLLVDLEWNYSRDCNGQERLAFPLLLTKKQEKYGQRYQALIQDYVSNLTEIS